MIVGATAMKSMHSLSLHNVVGTGQQYIVVCGMVYYVATTTKVYYYDHNGESIIDHTISQYNAL